MKAVKRYLIALAAGLVMAAYILWQKDIFGQDKAIFALGKAVKRARAGFRNPDKPEASYLFVGPTGCGKTELAINVWGGNFPYFQT